MRKLKYLVAGVAVIWALLGVGTAQALTGQELVLFQGSICDDVDAELGDLAGCDPDNVRSADVVVNDVLEIVLAATGLIAVGVMVYGGFVYLTSQGDPAKAKRGRDVILYGLIGLAVSMLAYAIVNFVAARLPN